MSEIEGVVDFRISVEYLYIELLLTLCTYKALLKTLHSVLNDGPNWAAGDSSSDVTPDAKLIGEIIHGKSRDDIPLGGDRSGGLRGVARSEVSETFGYILIYLIILHLNTKDRGS